MTTNPQAGMIGLTRISGDVGTGIEFGQWLNGEGFHAWEHAFLLLPYGNILEAEPGGAVIRPLHYDDVYWCTGIDKLLHPGVTPADVQGVAEHLKGVPYSFLDYAALAAHRLHIPGPYLRDFIATQQHMICSQLVDFAYELLGAQVFGDGRWPGYVTPASLYNRDRMLSS